MSRICTLITKTELGWTQDAYNSFQSETGDPTLQFVLEAYTLQLSNWADLEGAGTDDNTLDAVVAGDAVVRVWLGSNTIYVNTLASEDVSGQSWQQNTIAEADLHEGVPPSLVSSGDTVRVFYYTVSGAIEYRESADKGENWGAAQTVASIADVKFIAATTLTRVHYTALTSENNVRLGIATYSASWSTDNSYIWWPFLPSSFDAEVAPQYDDAAAATNDIIVFTTDYPPLVTHRVDGNEPVKGLERVQGIAIIRYQNGRWSHHHQYDTLDNVPSNISADGVTLARDNVRLSRIGDYLFMTYARRDGSADHGHMALAITRSKSGLHWEMPYLLDSDITGKCAKLVSRSTHAYIVSADNYKVRSNVTNYVGTTNVSYDLTDYVLGVDIREGDAKDLKVTISNPAGVLDTQLDMDTQWQMRLRLGYEIDGVVTNSQVILADLENISRSRNLPADHRVLGGRNALGRVASLKADLVQEWESWQAGGDNFQSLDDTVYSGLRHTAPYAGHWEAHSNVLQLRSGEATGIAANTQTSYVWNGSVQTSIKVSATTSDDFVGVIFRMLDKYNFWYAVYDADVDALKVNYRRDNEDVHDPCIISKDGMGWSAGTVCWLKVNFYYNYVNVYTSADGVSWTARCGGELPGVPSSTGFEFANIDTMRGAMGYIGHGYSEYTPSYPPPPWNPPPIDIPAPRDEWPADVYFCATGSGVGSNRGGVWKTSDFTDPDTATQPTWTKLSVTGAWPANNYTRAFAIDKDDPDEYIYVLVNNDDDFGVGNSIIRYSATSGTWTAVLGPGTLQGGDNMIADFVVNRSNGDLYAYTRGGNNYACHISSDRGSSWTRRAVYSSGSAAQNGCIGAYGNTIVMTTCSGLGGKTWVFYSTNNGVGWSNSAQMGSSAYFVDSYFNYVLANWVYVDAGGASSLNRYVLGGASTQIDSLTTFPRTDIFSPDPDDGTHVRMVYYNGNLYTTTDNWASGYTNKGRLDIGLNSISGNRKVTSIAELVDSEDFDWIMYGSTDGEWSGNPHTIYAANDEADITPEGKSGAHPDTGVDSIHYRAGGPCWRGIQTF